MSKLVVIDADNEYLDYGLEVSIERELLTHGFNRMSLFMRLSWDFTAEYQLYTRNGLVLCLAETCRFYSQGTGALVAELPPDADVILRFADMVEPESDAFTIRWPEGQHDRARMDENIRVAVHQKIESAGKEIAALKKWTEERGLVPASQDGIHPQNHVEESKRRSNAVSASSYNGE
jgi:hypothetical protein